MRAFVLHFNGRIAGVRIPHGKRAFRNLAAEVEVRTAVGDQHCSHASVIGRHSSRVLLQADSLIVTATNRHDRWYVYQH
jgi:allophanate hydrolase subunit 2